MMKFGTITAAAAAIGSSQPTITREVLRLETLVGFRLFERRRQRLHPTARAVALYHAIENAYSGLDQINTTLDRLRAASGELLQVSTLPTFAQSLLPEAVARLHRQVPGLCVEIVNGDPRNQSPISGFNFDLGLIEGEYSSPTTDVTVLGRFRHLCLIPAGHALARGTGPLSPADFEGQAFVSLAPHDPYRILLDRVFDEAGVTRHIPVVMQSANAVCEMVTRGVGVSILNPLTAMCYLDQGVVLRAFTMAPQFTVSALCPVARSWVDSTGQLVGHLQAICREQQTRLRQMGLVYADQ